MATRLQNIGDKGEKFIIKKMSCLKCKREGTLKQLPTNFKCVDLICDFCGHTSQVKTFTNDKPGLPKLIQGAAWKPQKERMDAGVYHSIWVVRADKNCKCCEAWLISSEVQDPNMFIKRKKLSETAKRAGWQGYNIDVESYKDCFIKMY